MKISHRNKQFIAIGGVSFLAATVSIQIVVGIMTGDPNWFSKIIGPCLLIIVGVGMFLGSRRAEEAVSVEAIGRPREDESSL